MDGTEITALAYTPLNNTDARIAAGMRSGRIGVYQYDGQGNIGDKIFAIGLDNNAVPIAVQFLSTKSRDLNVFGMFSGR